MWTCLSDTKFRQRREWREKPAAVGGAGQRTDGAQHHGPRTICTNGKRSGNTTRPHDEKFPCDELDNRTRHTYYS